MIIHDPFLKIQLMNRQRVFQNLKKNLKSTRRLIPSLSEGVEVLKPYSQYRILHKEGICPTLLGTDSNGLLIDWWAEQR